MRVTHRILWVTLLCFGYLQLVIAAPKTISSKALTQVVNTPVGSVKSGAVQVPVITWGADMRTIYANGSARTTSKGSIFGELGLNLRIVREDVFTKQVESYLSGKSPYLRGTLGMINMAAEVVSKDTRTKPIIIYQLSESAGGDALVVKRGIKSAKGLKGKTIALQAYGPHVAYLSKLLADAGLTVKDVKLMWLPDLTGSDNTPMAAFYEKKVDAAMVIIPDALALTSGGNIGTGSEDSVKGAKIMLSTKTANRIIADVYAVRADYFKSHKKQVGQFVHGLMLAQEAVSKLVANKASKSADYRQMLKASADILLDSPQATADAESLYADAEHISYNGNIKFFTSQNYPRNFTRRVKEIQKAFKTMGLLSKNIELSHASWDYPALKAGLSNVTMAEAPRFNESKVATVIARRQQQGTLEEGELFTFEVFFKPNQKSFSADHYADSFLKVVDLASTYGGAIITVEGHSDPMRYLRSKKKGSAQVVLRRIKQSAKNLSVTRAAAVRDSIIGFAKQKSIGLDASQFAIVGQGILAPKTGICGKDPCAPKNKQAWRSNMRVVFRIIQVEAESDVFEPL